MVEKTAGAFRTIGELSQEIGVAQHILRYWETRFSQLRPLTRSGNRRYYRPADVALVKKIQQLLAGQGYTIKGVQRVLAGNNEASVSVSVAAIAASPVSPSIILQLRAIRNRLANALVADAV